MRQSSSADDEAKREAGPGQRTGPTVPSLLLPAAGPLVVHCAFKSASPAPTL